MAATARSARRGAIMWWHTRCRRGSDRAAFVVDAAAAFDMAWTNRTGATPSREAAGNAVARASELNIGLEAQDDSIRNVGLGIGSVDVLEVRRERYIFGDVDFIGQLQNELACLDASRI